MFGDIPSCSSTPNLDSVTVTRGDFSVCGWPGRHGSELGLIERPAVLGREDIPMPIALVLGFAHGSSRLMLPIPIDLAQLVGIFKK